jgi:ribonuclease E
MEAGGSAEFESEPDEAAGDDDAMEPLTAPGQPGMQAGQHGIGHDEGGRRRRRRRGRRGRHREGTDVMQPAGQSRTGDAAAGGVGPFAPEAIETSRDVFTPNAPSAPQWSLSEQASGAQVTERPIAAAAPDPAENARERIDSAAAVEAPITQPEPATSQPEPEPASVEAEPESGREPRKGWWQRRFKM